MGKRMSNAGKDMIMEKYEELIIEILPFESDDIIITSDNDDDGEWQNT